MKDMKRIFKYFALAMIAAAGISCSREIILPEPLAGNGVIMLDVSSVPHTKAFTAEELASVGPEAYVNHIDLFICEGTSVSHYERMSYSSPAQPDTKILGKEKNYFETDKSYDIYVIANSTAAVSDMESVTDTDGLNALVQTDEFVHFTGLDVENVPEAFLMDAKLTGVVLNPAGEESEDKEVVVKLTRAAAKIFVELTEGSSDVKFGLPDNKHVYHFRNLPYSTKVLDGAPSHTTKIRSTLPHQVNDYVSWNTASDGTITFTGYVYEYDFSDKDLDMHTNLVVNIPLTIGTDEYPVNYYKIPLSNTLKFERNHIYRIRAEVNAPGAQTSYDPIEITDLKYDVSPWESYDPIQVGGPANKPKYLQLNTEHVDMYNINTDATTLRFASSSYITSIELVEAFYMDAKDTRIDLDDSDWAIYNQIEATFPHNLLNGGITIFSPFVKDEGAGIADSHKNTIRYMTFEVTNKDGLKEKFTVSQYPTLYITNEHGLYSYREDFSGRTSGVRWSSGTWSYYDSASQGSFFASKVAVASGVNYSIRYANWNNGSYTVGNSLSSFNNPRMYHIHITATSKDYVVAKPKLDSDGYTESSSDNSRLVSPSFLIASQLGATETGTGFGGSAVSINKAKQHCKQYMEVTRDGTVYKDWRLPTKAEIEIISTHQTKSPAMVVVMNGSHYYCALNPDYESSADDSYKYAVRGVGELAGQGSGGAVHVRCVHDAY